MAYCLNKCELIGNLTRDPELKQTLEGKMIGKISLATSQSWKTDDGETHTKAEYHNVVIFGKFAETACQYLHKGDKIYVEGMIQNSSWEDKETGEKRHKTEIVSKNLIFLNVKRIANELGIGDQENNLSDNEF